MHSPLIARPRVSSKIYTPEGFRLYSFIYLDSSPLRLEVRKLTLKRKSQVDLLVVADVGEIREIVENLVDLVVVEVWLCVLVPQVAKGMVQPHHLVVVEVVEVINVVAVVQVAVVQVAVVTVMVVVHLVVDAITGDDISLKRVNSLRLWTKISNYKMEIKYRYKAV